MSQLFELYTITRLITTLHTSTYTQTQNKFTHFIGSHDNSSIFDSDIMHATILYPCACRMGNILEGELSNISCRLATQNSMIIYV